MATKHVDVDAAIKAAKKDQRERFGIALCDGRLMVGHGSDARILTSRFRIGGTCLAEDGSVLGVLLENRAVSPPRQYIAPMSSLREPRKLAEHLEKIGLVSPLEPSDLKLIAGYVYAVGSVRQRVALVDEGVHSLAGPDTHAFVAVIGHQVVGPEQQAISVLNVPSVYESRGDLASWKSTMGRLLSANPLMILAVCFGLAVALARMANVNSMGLLIAGPSSTGKSTLARIVASLFRDPNELHQWTGTANGIEALARAHRDLPLVLDELGTADQANVLGMIYRTNGGLTKARATTTGALQKSEPLRTAVFATGEVTLRQHGGQQTRAGHDVRMPTIWVDEQFGVFSDIGTADDGAAFARRVNKSIQANFGVVLPAFLSKILDNQEEVLHRIAPLTRKATKTIGGESLHELSGIERRVLEGFANYAVAGELAAEVEVLPLKQGVATAAMGRVFAKWLNNFRAEQTDPLEGALKAPREFLKRYGACRFAELGSWETGARADIAGYTCSSRKYGELFLFFPSVFEGEVCKNHGANSVIAALRGRDLLVSGKKGRQLLVRMPGRNQDERISFYAVRKSILFEER